MILQSFTGSCVGCTAPVNPHPCQNQLVFRDRALIFSFVPHLLQRKFARLVVFMVRFKVLPHFHTGTVTPVFCSSTIQDLFSDSHSTSERRGTAEVDCLLEYAKLASCSTIRSARWGSRPSPRARRISFSGKILAMQNRWGGKWSAVTRHKICEIWLQFPNLAKVRNLF